MAHVIDELTALLDLHSEARTNMISLLVLFQSALKEEADKLFAEGERLEHDGRMDQALVHFASAATKQSEPAIAKLRQHVNTTFSVCCNTSPDEINCLLSNHKHALGQGAHGMGLYSVIIIQNYSWSLYHLQCTGS